MSQYNNSISDLNSNMVEYGKNISSLNENLKNYILKNFGGTDNPIEDSDACGIGIFWYNGNTKNTPVSLGYSPYGLGIIISNLPANSTMDCRYLFLWAEILFS